MPHAAVVAGYGPPETLAWSQVALPAPGPGPGPGQIRMRVHAAGVGPTLITLADEHAADFGVALPAPDAVEQTTTPLASGQLRLRARRLLPMRDAAQAHALLEADTAHEKLIFTS
jgi:hypothetical protein